MPDNRWFTIVGEIVGWLSRFDDPDHESDVAIVRVIEWREVGSTPWRKPESGLFTVVLRWLGNDYSVKSTSHIPRSEEDGPMLGDVISFNTSREEQIEYATWE